MAKYKEEWQSPIDQTIVGYTDTETGASIPNDVGNSLYQEFLIWQSGGGVADPAFTSEEISAYQEEMNRDAAIAYLTETATHVQRYRDDVAAGRRPFIPESKYKNLLKRRARAQRLIQKDFSDF